MSMLKGFYLKGFVIPRTWTAGVSPACTLPHKEFSIFFEPGAIPPSLMKRGF